MREPVTETTETWEIIYIGSDQAHLTREHFEKLGQLVDATFPDHFPTTGIRLSFFRLGQGKNFGLDHGPFQDFIEEPAGISPGQDIADGLGLTID